MFGLTKGTLERWSLLLGLPVALLSITSVVVPPAWDWLKGDYSKLEITLVYSDFERMDLLITNVGNRAAIITGMNLDASQKKYTDIILFPVKEEQKLVKAGEQVLLKAFNRGLIHAAVESFKDSTDLPQKTCSAVVKYRQYNSKEETAKYRFDCFIVDHDADIRIANLAMAGVDIPWPTFQVRVDGQSKIPNTALFEWAKNQPLTAREAEFEATRSDATD